MSAEAKTSSAAHHLPPRRAMDGSRIYTVSEFTREIRDLLEQTLGTVWVTGEVSNFRRPASGHCYFTLKDEFAQLSVVMWRTTAAALKFRIKDGLALVVQGELTVYEPRGRYQVVARRAEPLGLGELQLAFLQLKDRLAREGLFDPDRKKPLPPLPRRIAIVTSPTGAAVGDMLNVISRRFPAARLIICPTRVQGDEAAAEIAEMIRVAQRLPDVDVIIVGRGGGSIEDLWPFNEEVVARAIAGAEIPVVSAVGHETDFTIADFAADVRALTPTDAAVRVVPDVSDLKAEFDALAARLGQALLSRVAGAGERLAGIARAYAFRKPLDGIRAREQRLDDLCQQLVRDMGHTLQISRQRIHAVAARLESLSPLAVLKRGYSITFREPQAQLLRDSSKLAPGDLVRTRLAKGAFRARVVDVEAVTPRPTGRTKKKTVTRPGSRKAGAKRRGRPRKTP